MTYSVRDLEQLCESWWRRLEEYARDEQHRFAERFLGLLEWRSPSPLAMPWLTDGPAPLSYLLDEEHRTLVAAHFVLPGTVEPPGSVVDRGLDFCRATRRLVDATRAIGVPYALITDLYRTYFYDTTSEELLLWSDSPAAFLRDFGATLTRAEVDADSLEDLRREPKSVVARQLREWAARWADQLAAESLEPPERAALILDRLFVLRYWLETPVKGNPQWDIRERFAGLLAQAVHTGQDGIGQGLVALFNEARFEWNTGLFQPMGRLDSVLSRDTVAAPLLRDMALMSRNKFSLDIILESFNHGEAAEKARVRMIPEDNIDRSAYLARQTPEIVGTCQIALDLCDEGYRAIFFWFDRLLGVYDRLARESQFAAPPEPRDSGELDLIAWSERNAQPENPFNDQIYTLLEQGLVVYCATERQERVARLLLHLHVMNAAAARGARLDRMPPVETALKPRPKVLESDRRAIYHGSNVDHEWQVI